MLNSVFTQCHEMFILGHFKSFTLRSPPLLAKIIGRSMHTPIRIICTHQIKFCTRGYNLRKHALNGIFLLAWQVSIWLASVHYCVCVEIHFCTLLESHDNFS